MMPSAGLLFSYSTEIASSSPIPRNFDNATLMSILSTTFNANRCASCTNFDCFWEFCDNDCFIFLYFFLFYLSHSAPSSLRLSFHRCLFSTKSSHTFQQHAAVVYMIVFCKPLLFEFLFFFSFRARLFNCRCFIYLVFFVSFCSRFIFMDCIHKTSSLWLAYLSHTILVYFFLPVFPSRLDEWSPYVCVFFSLHLMHDWYESVVTVARQFTSKDFKIIYVWARGYIRHLLGILFFASHFHLRLMTLHSLA